METTFSVLTAPLQKFFKLYSKEIDKKSDSRKLKFAQFTLTMLYSFMMQKESLRKISNHLKLSDKAKNLNLAYIPWTTLRDGFLRFDYDYFMRLYRFILKNTKLLKVKALDEVGLISLVDGSLFPTIISMDWAEYKKTKNAIRLHVEFSLNQMIPLEFNGLTGNSSERHFLKKIVQKGVTYIADRGYFSFDIADIIVKASAFFILRIKNNMKIEVGKVLKPTGKIPSCLKELQDELIRFTSDPNQRVYRRIKFTVLDSEFQIVTNRLGLTTLEIIMLYAYRWQIELLFKFIKRFLNGIHLFNHSKNGVNIQFCLLMILSVIYLSTKQFCKTEVANVKKQKTFKVPQNSNLENFNVSSYFDPEKWVNSINKAFKGFWKISSYWLDNLKELIDKPFDDKTIRILAGD
jgi:transposase